MLLVDQSYLVARTGLLVPMNRIQRSSHNIGRSIPGLLSSTSTAPSVEIAPEKETRVMHAGLLEYFIGRGQLRAGRLVLKKLGFTKNWSESPGGPS